uniref:Putative secreted protein n=1 Tax=Anopheles marajoara TaxID=58244 RepID=A0A2M4CCG6_9DIPT
MQRPVLGSTQQAGANSQLLLLLILGFQCHESKGLVSSLARCAPELHAAFISALSVISPQQSSSGWHGGDESLANVR